MLFSKSKALIIFVGVLILSGCDVTLTEEQRLRVEKIQALPALTPAQVRDLEKVCSTNGSYYAGVKNDSNGQAKTVTCYFRSEDRGTYNFDAAKLKEIKNG